MAWTRDVREPHWIGSSEVWTDKDGSDTYSHTSFVARCGNDFCYAETRLRGNDNEIKLLRPSFQSIPIPRDEIYPIPPNDVRTFPQPLDTSFFFLRRPDYTLYADFRGTTVLAQQFHAEVQVLEILTGLRHRKLACYCGCILDGGRIVAIVLTHYKCTLEDRLAYMDLQSRLDCLSSVRAGIHELHEIGLAHNDLNPRNIIFDHDDVAVIIDHDSCAIDGTPLRKLGTPGWNERIMDVSSLSNDAMCLRRLEEELIRSYEPKPSTQI